MKQKLLSDHLGRCVGQAKKTRRNTVSVSARSNGPISSSISIWIRIVRRRENESNVFPVGESTFTFRSDVSVRTMSWPKRTIVFADESI
jgi:hypothetical protein